MIGRLPRAFPGALLLIAIGLAPAAAQAQKSAPPGDSPPSSATPGATPGVIPGAAPSWLPRGVAELQALDKVNARHTVLSVKIGETARIGSLRIDVLACAVRPPDQPQDAAAFLSITDANGDGVGFRGWMVASQPALSMLQHPVFDIRVTGCRP